MTVQWKVYAVGYGSAWYVQKLARLAAKLCFEQLDSHSNGEKLSEAIDLGSRLPVSRENIGVIAPYCEKSARNSGLQRLPILFEPYIFDNEMKPYSIKVNGNIPDKERYKLVVTQSEIEMGKVMKYSHQKMVAETRRHISFER